MCARTPSPWAPLPRLPESPGSPASPWLGSDEFFLSQMRDFVVSGWLHALDLDGRDPEERLEINFRALQTAEQRTTPSGRVGHGSSS